MGLSEERKSYDKEWKAKDYLKNYYGEVDSAMVRKFVLERTAASENARIMIFLADIVSPSIRAHFGLLKPTLLELGGGPTVYQLFSVANLVQEIHFTDYVEDNLSEVRKWVHRDPKAFRWSAYAKIALMLKDDIVNIHPSEVKNLENLVRKKIKKIAHCDVLLSDLGIKTKSYNIVSTHFLAEGISSSKAIWRKVIRNIGKKVSKNGLLIISMVVGAKGWYKVLDKKFPATEVYPEDLRNELQKDGFSEVRIVSIKTEEPDNNYQGIMFAISQKK